MAISAHGQDRFLSLITVTGEANVSVAPDLAELRGGVVSQGKTARQASEANAKSMTTVLAALTESGIAAADMKTSRVSIQPVRENQPGTAGRIASFQASNQVTVRIRDIGRVGDVIDRLVAAGANEIWGVEFLVSNPSQALDAARPEAIADARRKAEIYARAAGLTLGRAYSISEDGASSPMPLRAAAARAAAATSVVPGNELLRLVVTVSFELQR
jgi:uncharacterized protein YggE